MRTVAPVWFLIVVGAAACGGGGGGGGGDDGPGPPGDAAAGDGAGPDGADPLIDAAGIDAPVAGPVTLTVSTRGGPAAGVAVVWTDAAGALIAQDATGADGAVTRSVLAGGAVTLAATVAGVPTTVSWLAVEPGDALTWELEPAPAVRHGDVSVTLPGAQQNATRYRVQLGCGPALTTTTPAVAVTGTIGTTCLGSDGTLDVVASALNASGGIVGYAVRTDVTTVAGGTTAVAMGAWQTSLGPLAVALTGVPAGSSNLTLEPVVRSDGRDFRGVEVGGLPSSSNVTLQSGYYQGGVVERLRYRLVIIRGGAQGTSLLLAGRADAPASVSHDLAALAPTLAAAAASDAGGRVQLEWTATGALAGADGLAAAATWRDGATTHRTYVIAPPGTTAPLVVPALPDPLAAYRSTATSTFEPPSIMIADADFVTDYRGFRPVARHLFGGGGLPIVPASGGTVRVVVGGLSPPL